MVQKRKPKDNGLSKRRSVTASPLGPGTLPVIPSEGTPKSHNRDPELCLLSEGRNQVRNDRQQITVFSTLWAPHCVGFAGSLS